LEAQVQQIKALMGQFERRLDQLTARQNELSRDSQSRLDRLDNQMTRLEDGISRLASDTSQRVAELAGRINERKVSDTKVQELIDRHNLMVRNFENRLSSMQKLASDQEQALLSAFAALEDARAELSRLKRMT
jgi:archaellum component FlaC